MAVVGAVHASETWPADGVAVNEDAADVAG